MDTLQTVIENFQVGILDGRSAGNDGEIDFWPTGLTLCLAVLIWKILLNIPYQGISVIEIALLIIMPPLGYLFLTGLGWEISLRAWNAWLEPDLEDYFDTFPVIFLFSGVIMIIIFLSSGHGEGMMIAAGDVGYFTAVLD